MYSYYFLATFPAIKERLWWKKHLTKFQLVSYLFPFDLALFHCYYLLNP